jgi:O-Antigen ligase
MFARNALLSFGIAAVVFTLSYANGGFDTTTKAYAGISAWWILGLGAAIGVGAARSSIDRLALVTVGLFAAFAVWTLISMQWASDKGRAFAQFDQVSLYVAVLAIAIIVARLVPAYVLTSGVALALTAIAVVALVSRLFPSTFGVQPSILPTLNSRLSFPLGYWNGLGIQVALAYPLLLAAMASRRSRIGSALAALPLPVLAAVMYLTSSRGAFVAAVVAVAVYLLLSPSRWPALAAAALAAAVGAIVVATLVHRNELLAGDMTNPVAVHQGHRAALVIGIACVVTALVWVGLTEVGRRLRTPPPFAGWATAGVIVLVAFLVIGFSHPIAKFDAFKSSSFVANTSSTSYVNQHLLSSSGSGRWQFWGAAISEFHAHPVIGGGAGSWLSWWLQHGTLGSFFTQYAHSLYLETLGELGILGLLLLGGAVVVGVVGAVRSALGLRSGEVAAAAACTIAFFAAAAYDWVWQLSGVAVVGVGLLGVALGARPSLRQGEWSSRFGVVRPLVALLAVAAIIPLVVVLAAGIHLRNSVAADNANDLGRAKSEALAAKTIEPWDAATWLQLATVDEHRGEYDAASMAIRSAIRRSPRDYLNWEEATRIDALRGDVPAVLRDLHQARLLNPNSPLFQSGS